MADTENKEPGGFKRPNNYRRRRFNKYRDKKYHNDRTKNENPQPDKVSIPTNKSISVVIPLLNEVDSLRELSDKLQDVMGRINCQYEVIFVDDGSTDGSFGRISEIHNKNNRFKCIKLRKNYGKSAALAAGFKAVKGDYVFTMDADLQDDPDEIPEMLKILLSGFDLVSGWKKIRYDPFIKRNTSKIFNYVTSKLSGIRLHDFNCGIKGYKKDVVKSLKVYGEMHRYLPAIAHLSGFRVTEKIVKHHPRKFGKTKFGASRFINGFLDVLTVVFTTKYMKKPLHLFGTLGMISFLAGFIITLYLSLLKILDGASISNRPLFLGGILFIIVGIQFFSIGFIAEMITKSTAHEEDFLIETIL
ncbi:MAG: glycosyltransferase family 2 protein [Ignavibacteria bacterium]|nr:glycosyltransferase family 2 protein [Ignavibacteria bacterium]